MRTPVVLLTGVEPEPMSVAMMALQSDLPNAVAVRHHIDVEAQVLERVVSDLTGVVEHERIELEHACISCALREDIVPTLNRLAREARWDSIVAHLPVGAEANQVCNVLAWDSSLARRLRISAVMTALTGPTVVDDLLGDDLLVERGHHSSHEDRRGVGEVACAMAEYADVVTLTDAPDRRGSDLLRGICRPNAQVLDSTSLLEGALLVEKLHDHSRTVAWTATALSADLPDLELDGVWRVDLRSDRPFHPERLIEGLESLGAGRHRSRGCFWLPTRPGRVLEWDGAGGQLSIGDAEPWGRRAPFTRLVLAGVGEAPGHLRDAFEHLLLSPQELSSVGSVWPVAEDGFEPWLGAVREVA